MVSLPTQSMGTIRHTVIVPTLCAHRYTQVLLKEYDDDRSNALRGNASQDAPRPLSNVAQMCATFEGVIHVMRSAHRIPSLCHL
ncbi:hypothetical protein CFBP1590__4662 [Pseudomonas viridiflava]|uniref:Uncharacterized protein n=1 Tax=Pseudomonas viridiflava TaxID=33069 RepID=A0A1Y6JQM4_PSEVI|nr:hypothetical protein CFBP1590__4662 [Pseudomonas viridiflava]VVM37934.1 hypothetical protein PS634_00121 [Pseudomonas fluorescens]